MDPVLEEWRRFVEGSPLAGLLPEVILESWQRSERSGVNPRAAEIVLHRVGEAELCRRLAASAELLALAKPHLDWLSASLSKVPHAVYLTDRDGIVLHATGTLADLDALGLTPGYDWSERRMGTNGAGTALIARQPVAVIGCQHFLTAFQDCTCTAAPIHGPGGEVLGAVDITTRAADGSPERLALAAHAAFVIAREIAYREELRRVESDLARRLGADEPVTRLLEAIGEGLLLLDGDGRILFLNGRAEALLRRDRKELLGGPVWAALPESAIAEFRAAFAAGLRDQVRVHLEVPCPELGVWWVIDLHPARDGMAVSLRDVTEPRRIQQSLLETNTRLQTILDNTTAIVYMMDTEGRYLLVNRQAEKNFGMNGEHVRGRSAYEFFPREVADQFIANNQHVLAAGTAAEIEEHVPQSDGLHTYISIKVPVFDSQGKPYAICGISTDITDRKRAEERERQLVQELREKDARKDEFLAMLAHELRNPLAPIRNATQILHLREAMEPELRWGIQVIDRQIQHMSRLVDDLLDISRITQGKIQLRKAPLELHRVVESAVETSRSLIEARGHHLWVALPPQPLWVEGDAARLAQVISNLLNNAAKFTQAGGEIRLRVESSDGRARIAVSDTGVGIAAEMIPKIFEPFVQGNAGPERAEGGLGIGLALVKRLVELHGGEVDACSPGPNRGSEFVISLPLPATDLPQPAQGADLPPATRHYPRRRILVVDDNRDSADTLAALFDLLGQEVKAVHDGKSALAAARKFKPEIGLLDIGMPGMDGYEVARRLRSQPGMKRARLIALTGYGQADDIQRSREAGFDDHLVKPVSLDLLKRLLWPPAD